MEGKLSFVWDRLSRNALVGSVIVVVAVLNDLGPIYYRVSGQVGDSGFDTPDLSSK